jgi:hypothetical protein
LYVPAAQAQDIIEKVTETQDSTADSLRTSSALSTISSDAVEIKTKNTQPSVEQGNQERNKDLACNNKNFTSSIGGGFLSNTPFERKDKTPSNYAAFKPDCLNPAANGECWDKPRYYYYATFPNIKEWRGKICAKSVESANHTHVINYQTTSSQTCPIGGQKYCQLYEGPTVGFQVKGHNQPEKEWNWLKKDEKLALYEIPASETQVSSWAWKTSQPSDFRLVVWYAKPLDEFDFMMDQRTVSK